MPIEHYIRTTLNLGPERIESIDTVHKDQKMEVSLILRDEHPVCKFCSELIHARTHNTAAIDRPLI